jgi:toxin-antitoxin system PIN domain toxin
VLIDTNVLVYAADQTSPFHGDSRAFRERGRGGEFVPCITPQILFEFYAVITDPRRVHQPLTAAQAASEMAQYFDDPKIRKIHPGEEIGAVVLSLIRKYTVVRQDIFDVVIVATMIVNGIPKICSYDTAQFSRFREIEVMRPGA